MPVNLNTVISALDTPSSLYQFWIKDSFDVTGRTIMAHNEGGKHESREKFIEEAGTSLFWIGGIPAVRKIANTFAKNKFDTDIHFKRINSQGPQSYFSKNLEGIELGGEKLKQIQKKLAGEGLKKYKNYHTGITIASVLINLIMLTVALPQFNQFLSRKIISKETKEKQNKQTNNSNVQFGQNKQTKSNNKQQSFGSLASLKDFVNVKDLFNFVKMAENAQLSVTSSMLILDYGISGSRITFIPRNTNERIEYIVKEGGIILFFYYAADLIKTGLSHIANKLFNIPIDLDYKIIASKEFLGKIKSSHNKNELLKFTEIAEKDENAELKVIKFIDKELAKTSKETLKEKVFNNFTLQMAQKEGLIDVEYDAELGKWVRHSKKYIQTDKVIDLNNNLKNFYEKALDQCKSKTLNTEIENIISKTKKVKIASIIGNMAICCASLSFILPKIQYAIREHRTQTKSAPGIKMYQDLAKNNQLKV